MPRNVIHTVSPWYLQPMRWMAYVSVASYYRIAFRIRSWGALPLRRGPTLIVANHQHELESPVIVADVGLRTLAWRDPIFTVSSRRMWEPGFFAERIPWLRVAREANFGWLFGSIGMQPIENELQTRPYASIAYTLIGLYGDLPVESVLRERALVALPPGVRNLSDLLTARHFAFARSYVRIPDVLEPYRDAVMRATRTQLDADIAHFEDLQRAGATIFLTPEGFYSGDGKMRPLRGILARLAPLASVWLTAVSYDPYDAKRLTMLYRVTPAREGIALDLQLKAARPITTSALVCTYLAEHPNATEPEVVQAVNEQVAALPPAAFVVPELREQPASAVRRVLENLRRMGRKHPQFPRTQDMIVYQANFHAETLEGLAAT
ncbi:MAG TPA: hypothetical protein VMG98_02695 [Verrucomicrobiae bacterium]|nr:hypothetical protein [Verrucomicrobiae bacterium]